ncbi:SpoIIE family protein phosphatase [Streptomyces fumanus]|uniref:SpoIIE family protein phosphatase n=1 Tax=Streptomyces fumanus TaxID=67302 RepID=UPI0033FE5592
MPALRCRVLLAGLDDAAEAALRTELAADAEIIRMEHPAAPGPDGAGRPTLLVVGPAVTAPNGLVATLTSRIPQLGIVMLVDDTDRQRTQMLSLLTTEDRRVGVEDLHLLPGTARAALEQLVRAHSYRATQAALQRTLEAASAPVRQPGEQLFGPLFHQSLIGALAVDDEGRITAWNRKAARTLSLSSASIGCPLPDLFPEHVRPQLIGHLAAADDSSQQSSLFTRIVDGRPQLLRIGTQRSTAADGTLYTLVVLEDITAATDMRRELAERTSHALLAGDVADAMTSNAPLAERLQRCVQAVVDRLHAAFARVWVLKPDENVLHLTASAGLYTHLDGGHSRIKVGQLKIGLIAAERRPHLTNSVIGDPRVNDQEWAEREGMTAFAGYPLITNGELIGVMALFSREPLPSTALDALAGIADRIAVGIRQDQLLNRLRTTTEALQAPLLPPALPAMPGLDVAVRYRAQGDSLQIGGDFYDVFPLDDGRWALALGDICGKGPVAAAATGLVRHTLWTATQQDPAPGYVLPLVHRALRRDNSPFCTLVYALIDPRAVPGPRVQVTSAGHPYPILRRADGATTLLQEHGPMLGVFDHLHHPVRSLDLRPGDTLVLYTDGFTEGAGNYRSREPEDLAEEVQALRVSPDGSPAEEIAGALFASALERWGDKRRDDLALLAVTASP